MTNTDRVIQEWVDNDTSVATAPQCPVVEHITWSVIPDDDPDPSYLYQDGIGFEDRRAAYERGEFAYIGVRATAELIIAGTYQEITSPGLWGVEDDSANDYLEAIAKDEVNELHAILLEMGIDARDITAYRK